MNMVIENVKQESLGGEWPPSFAEFDIPTIEVKSFWEKSAGENFISNLNKILRRSSQRKPCRSPSGKDTSSLVKMDISSINRKDFRRKTIEIDADEVFRFSSDDVVELDIVISPFKE